MPYWPLVLVLPAQPERLRLNREDIRVGVQQHQPVTLQPRFVPDVLTAGGEEPQPGKAALTSAGCQLAYRTGTLERNIPAQRQRPMAVVRAITSEAGGDVVTSSGVPS